MPPPDRGGIIVRKRAVLPVKNTAAGFLSEAKI